MRQRTPVALAALAALVLGACSSGGGGAGSGSPAASRAHVGAARPSAATSAVTTAASSSSYGVDAASTVPRYSHVVVVVEENHAYGEVVGSPSAPYVNSLARQGTLLTASYGVRHPSEPNYLALFSGSTQGLTDDSCPHTYRGTNLGYQLRSHGASFVGYSESLPSTGWRGCNRYPYARRHAPWVNFSNLPGSVSKPFSAFPSNYAALPRVSFVVPNVLNDMHDGSVARGDTWLKNHLARYASWARTHNSLLIVTWDEDDTSASNRIPGVLVGAHVRHTRYGGRVDHYRMLRTIEAATGLPGIGAARNRTPISGIWN